MIEIDKAKQLTMNLMLKSFIHYLNNVLGEGLTEEEKNDVANVIFNVMTNSLQPDVACMWNDEIFKIIEKHMDDYDNVLEDIYKDLGWNKII